MPVTLSSSLEDFHSAHPGLAEKLGTNHVPSPVEADALKRTLPGILAEISAPDEEISRIQTVLSEVQRSRDGVAKHAADMEALMSPARPRRMPWDIWSLIFASGAPILEAEAQGDEISFFWRPNSETPAGFGSYHSVPLNWGLVCKRWREISCATPSVWSHLLLEVEEHPTREADVQIAAGAKIWLERSGTSRLTILLRHPQRSHYPIYPPIRPSSYKPHETWDLLLLHMWRCEKLHCSLVHSWLGPLFAAPPLHLPHLKNLAVQRRADSAESLYTVSVLSLGSAPLLDNVYMDGTVLKLLSTPTNVPTDLSYLSFVEPSGSISTSIEQDFIDILSHSPRLEYLCVALNGHPRASSVVSSAIILPHLKVFRLSRYGAPEDIAWVVSLLDKLHSPNVEELSIFTRGTVDSEDASTSFVSRLPLLKTLSLGSCSMPFRKMKAAPSVESLTVSGTDLHDLRATLTCACNLKCLYLSVYPYSPDPDPQSDNEMMRVLVADSPNCLVPHLEHLDIHASDCNDDVIIDMVESRMNSQYAAVLKSCKIVMRYAPSRRMVTKAKEWRKFGLAVQLGDVEQRIGA